MDDEQWDIKIKPITKKNHWGNELAIKLNGQTQNWSWIIGLKKETEYAKPCLKLRQYGRRNAFRGQKARN